MPKSKSQQPRFDITEADEGGAFYLSTLNWMRLATEQAPEYVSDTRELDRWLQWFWVQEPHLAGVLNSVISIDSNRGWSVTGGRNQVLRWSKILHNWEVSPGLMGWRPGCSTAALSYYTSNLGGVIELGRDGASGPVRKLYHTDPTQCKMTGSKDTPLRYYPRKARAADSRDKLWGADDFMRCVSMPSILEAMNGIGYCALMRCLILAQITIAIYQHDKEQLGAQAPRGLLLLMGITEKQWIDSMKTRKANLEAKGLRYYDAVNVLASSGMEQIDAKLIALSQLPANFNLQEFTSLLMYGYALCFGYDPSEFYPVQFGSLGRGTEMEVQHEKATSKGGMNFAYALQEQLQREDVLPSALAYEFDERDDTGDLVAAQSALAQVQVFRAMRETGLLQDGVGGISRDEFRLLLADKGLIDQDWTLVPDEAEATDETSGTEDTGEPSQDTQPLPETPPEPPVNQIKKRLLEMPQVWEAADKFPDEPILRYHYKFPHAKVTVLWKSGSDLFEKRVHRVIRAVKDDPVLYSSGEVTITQSDADRAINNAGKRVSPEYKALLTAQLWESDNGKNPKD
jgi:hypothetical protein